MCVYLIFRYRILGMPTSLNTCVVAPPLKVDSFATQFTSFCFQYSKIPYYITPKE